MTGGKAYVFPGQGSQFCGMAKDLYEGSSKARSIMESANEILGFRITDVMFGDDPEALKATAVTQPAVFLHSVTLASCLNDFHPDMMAGHSLGEFSALAAAGALGFEDALRLVSIRAHAMQKACQAVEGTMAAIIGLPDEQVSEICSKQNGTVVAANFNCPGQVVISGEESAVDAACEALRAAGARRALKLQVGGAFHSPLMAQAREELAKAIEEAPVHAPLCPIYQNVSGTPSSNPAEIKEKLLQQLTSPVMWSQTIRNMVADGAASFTELGPGNVLRALIGRTAGNLVEASSLAVLPQSAI